MPPLPLSLEGFGIDIKKKKNSYEVNKCQFHQKLQPDKNRNISLKGKFKSNRAVSFNTYSL